MRFGFRALFTMILCLLLGGFGATAGLQLQHLPALWIIPSGQDLILNHPGYQTEVTIMLTAVGLLLGFWIGPRIGDMIIEGGRSMERLAAADKIAAGIGAALGVIVSLPFYQLLSTSPAFFKVITLVLINVILIYLGIVAMMSMKNELVLILARVVAAFLLFPTLVRTLALRRTARFWIPT